MFFVPITNSDCIRNRRLKFLGFKSILVGISFKGFHILLSPLNERLLHTFSSIVLSTVSSASHNEFHVGVFRSNA